MSKYRYDKLSLVRLMLDIVDKEQFRECLEDVVFCLNNGSMSTKRKIINVAKDSINKTLDEAEDESFVNKKPDKPKTKDKEQIFNTPKKDNSDMRKRFDAMKLKHQQRKQSMLETPIDIEVIKEASMPKVLATKEQKAVIKQTPNTLFTLEQINNEWRELCLTAKIKQRNVMSSNSNYKGMFYTWGTFTPNYAEDVRAIKKQLLANNINCFARKNKKVWTIQANETDYKRFYKI